MKNFLTILGGAALLGLSSCACAATIPTPTFNSFDFAALANGNVQKGKSLTPTFDQVVKLNTVWFKDATHGTSFGGKFKLKIDGTSVYNKYGLASSINLRLHGTIIKPTVSAVPIPAAAWLFGSGLLGLVAFGRRKMA